MQVWPSAKTWLRIGVMGWTLLCLTVAWHRNRANQLDWMREQENALFHSSLALLSQLEATKTDASIAAHFPPKESELFELERKFHVALRTIDTQTAPTAFLSTEDRVVAPIDCIEWQSRPLGSWELSMIAKQRAPEVAWYRLHRTLAPPSWSVYADAFWVWCGGLLLCGTFFFWQTQAVKRWESAIHRWSKTIQQVAKPMVHIPHFEGTAALPLANWTEFHDALDRIQSELEGAMGSSEQSNRILDGMTEGVIALDQELKVLYCNPAAISLLDVATKQPQGRLLIELVRQPRVSQLVQDTSLLDDSQMYGIQECEVEVGSLHKRYLRMRAIKIAKSPGRIVMILTVSDETKLKKLENLRREFTANVSHELKTPLAAIKAYSETLLMGALEDEGSNRRFVERISEQSDRLQALIQDLLQLASLQDSPKLELANVQLAKVVRQSIDCYSAIAESKQIRLEVENFSESVAVATDREAVSTILNNLIGNAIRYTGQGGWVKVVGSFTSGTIHFRVADNGIGIAKEEQDRIFERFYRVDKSRNSDIPGTGLGLAIVKHLVQALGGEIEVRSELGKGSEFVVSFRAAATRDL
ncbi:MAG: ATP-binding protein [Pirellulales bacterium]